MMFALRVVVREKGVRAGVVVAAVLDGGVVVMRKVVVGRRGIAPGSLVAIFCVFFYMMLRMTFLLFALSAHSLAGFSMFQVPVKAAIGQFQWFLFLLLFPAPEYDQ